MVEQNKFSTGSIRLTSGASRSLDFRATGMVHWLDFDSQNGIIESDKVSQITEVLYVRQNLVSLLCLLHQSS